MALLLLASQMVLSICHNTALKTLKFQMDRMTHLVDISKLLFSHSPFWVDIERQVLVMDQKARNTQKNIHKFGFRQQFLHSKVWMVRVSVSLILTSLGRHSWWLSCLCLLWKQPYGSMPKDKSCTDNQLWLSVLISSLCLKKILH